MNSKQIELPDDTKETRVINGHTYGGHPDALNAMEASYKRAEERKASIPWKDIDHALKRVMECLRDHDTHSTVQLKRFIWCLWNGHHIVNLYNLGRPLDDDNSDAVATIFTAYMRGMLSEEHLRWVLKESGEMRRFENAEKATPERCTVDYPAMPESVREHCRKLDREAMP
jgi:hypothetical protein